MKLWTKTQTLQINYNKIKKILNLKDPTEIYKEENSFIDNRKSNIKVKNKEYYETLNKKD